MRAQFCFFFFFFLNSILLLGCRTGAERELGKSGVTSVREEMGGRDGKVLPGVCKKQRVSGVEARVSQLAMRGQDTESRMRETQNPKATKELER